MDPIASVALFVLLPAVAIVTCAYFTRPADAQSNTALIDTTWMREVPHVVVMYSNYIVLGSFALGVLLCYSQATVAAESLCFSDEIDYYLKVDLPAYDAWQSISDAENENSIAVLAGDMKGVKEKVWRDRKRKVLTLPWFGDSSIRNSRRLSAYGSGSDLSIVYHNKPWDNILTNEYLYYICRTELNIMRNVECINEHARDSMIKRTFDDDCNYLSSFENSLPAYGAPENFAYVEDNVDPQWPTSSILISFFELGFCYSDGISADELLDQMNDQAYPDANTITVTFVEAKYMNAEFLAAIYNAAYVTIITLIVCAGFLVLGVRGVVLSTVTLLCIFISICNAAAVLTSFGYSCFSAFNVMGVFILIGVGVNAVLLFDFTWRQEAKLAESIPALDDSGSFVTDRASRSECLSIRDSIRDSIGPETSTGDIEEAVRTQLLQRTFSRNFLPILFTTIAAVVSLFSKLISPVVVISQLGAFMGVAVIVFYACFHYIIIPMYVYLAKFSITRAWEAVLRGVGIGVGVDVDVDVDVDASDASDMNDAISTNGTSNAEKLNKNSSEFSILKDTAGKLSESESPADAMPGAFAGLHTPLLNDCGLASQNDVEHENEKPGDDASEAMESGMLTTRQEGRAGEELGVDERLSLLQDRKSALESAAGSRENDIDRGLCAWCLGLGPSLLLAIVILALIATGLVLMYHMILRIVNVDFGIPQLFPPASLMGQAMIILKDYKSDLLSSSLQSSADPVGDLTFYPTFQPTVFTGSASPTQRPTPLVSRVSSAPTPAFDSRTPTVFPTQAPVVPPTDDKDSVSTMDYEVNTCWGIYSKKDRVDSNVEVSYNSDVFAQYMEAGVGRDIVEDMRSLCSYVSANRLSLNVHPEWVDADCIYEQYTQFVQEGNTVTENIMLWGTSDFVASTLIGVEEQVPGDVSTYRPVWVCAAFAMESNVSSLMSEPDVALTLSDRWHNAFTAHGCTYASVYNVPAVTGSNDFTFPLLASEVVTSIELAGLISLCGFLGLLILFTRGDVGVTIMGALSMSVILVVAFFLHLQIVTYKVDLLDIVVLIAVTGMVVDFPAHFIMEYVSALDEQKKATGENEELKFSSEEQEDDVDMEGGSDKEVGNAKWWTRFSSVIVPDALRTSKYMQWALLAPLLLTMLTGIPLLFATFQLLQKAGQYIIILCATSYVFCIVILPTLLPLNWRTLYPMLPPSEYCT